MRKPLHAAVLGVFVSATLAVPIAQAWHPPSEESTATPPHRSLPPAAPTRYVPTRWSASPLEIDRLGPKHVPLHHPQSAASVEANRPGPTAAGTAIANARHDAMPVRLVKVVRSGGFDWADAGIGAGIASVTLALVAVVAMFVTRRTRKTIVPERSEPAGT